MIKTATLLVVSAALLVSAASGSAAGASDCKLIKVADWPVRVERNHLIVDGTINGQKIGAIVDTGATKTLVLRAAAERLALPRQQTRRYRMFGVGGETNVEIAFVDELKLEQTVRKGWRVIVAGEGDFGADVLLGEDFFQLFDMEFDLAHNALRMYQPKDCDGVSLAYWANAGVGQVAIEAVDEARPQIVLTVQLNGQPIKAELDSGASITMLDKRQAARLGVTPETPGVIATGKGSGLGRKSVDAWIGRFESFVIGNELIGDTEIMFADWHRDIAYNRPGSLVSEQLPGLHAMLLGADFLRSHRVLVAHSQRKIYFTYVGGPVFQPPQQPAPPGDPRADDSAKPKQP